MYINEPAHDKTYNKTSVTSKHSDKPVHPPRMAKVLIYLSLDNQEAAEDTCDQQIPIRLGRCTGLSESLLVAQVLQVLSCAGSNKILEQLQNSVACLNCALSFKKL